VDPRSIDGHVQLGHLLKNTGRPAAAMASFASALEIDALCSDALRELIGMGKGAAASARSNAGFQLLGQVTTALAEMKNAVVQIERALPDIQSLCSVPATDFSLFKARFRLPPAPPPVKREPWTAVVLDDPSADVVTTLRSIAQVGDWRGVVIVNARPSLSSELLQWSNFGLLCPVEMVESIASAACGNGWLLLVQGGTELLSGALAWMAWAGSHSDVLALYADEELIELDEKGRPAGSRGYFKSAYDSDAGGSCHGHSMLAVRAGTALAVGADGDRGAVIDDIERQAGSVRRIAHVPRVLSRRLAPAVFRQPLANASSAASEDKIAVIIPTRDGGENLRKCLDAARTLADAPDTLHFIVVDNGPSERRALECFEQKGSSLSGDILVDRGPFNWSRLNNLAVKSCKAPILLFLNDDVEVRTKGWDTQLRQHLGRAEIGAVGCRLVYPDGSLQHAGIVLGPDGTTAHEGKGLVTPETRHRWSVRRVVGAVTGAFLACRRSDFEAVDGFDEARFPIWFNDVDFCLKLRACSVHILYVAGISGIHRESTTLNKIAPLNDMSDLWRASAEALKRRWPEALIDDPGFNPHFLRSGKPFEQVTEPTQTACMMHLRASASSNPWRVQPASDNGQL
jgi:O-antigen biosynthesis protein